MQDADFLSAFPDYRDVVRDSGHALVAFMLKVGLAIHVGTFHISAKADFHLALWIHDFPRIIVFQPGIRQFHLLAVLDLLTEEAKLIPKANAAAVHANGGHGI